jgi:hypothetical protein
MATTAAPYGLRPINLIGGQSFAGSTRLLPIVSGQTTNCLLYTSDAADDIL